MFAKAIITKLPNGRFHFVGRVPAELLGAAFDTVEAAKIAAIDVMIARGEAFPVDVQAID